jgi:hypothetical protein
MSDDVRFERLLADVLADAAPARAPDALVPDILAAARRARRRPRWLALAIERPMRLDAQVVVGSPTKPIPRTTFAAAAVVALLALGAALLVVSGGPSPAPSEEPSPSLPAIVAPSSTPSVPSAAPTASPVNDPAGVWIATGAMVTPRINYAAVRLLDGRVLVIGGERGSNGETVTTVELYDQATGTWSVTGSMLKGLEGFPPTVLGDGRVLVGDADEADDAILGAEVYDPATGTWTATGQPVPGSQFDGGTATLLRNGTVLVAGDNGAQVYDPDSGTWTVTGTLTTPRYGHAATLMSDGRVLVVGGDVIPDIVVDSAEVYDPDTGAWTAIANMQAPREPIGAFLQPDGKVLVVGASRLDPRSLAELYDPATGAWTATVDMPAPGFGATAQATLLWDGKLLLGYGSDPPSAELYDPDAGTWTTTAPMLRSHATPGERASPAILLLDGTVLVAGGSDCLDLVCVPTGSAELYVPAGVSPPPLPAFPSPPPPVFPSPTPIPTPFPPAAGPIPPNARSWTVTVDNKSSEPATLFVAEEDEHGISRLVGSAIPNVVPADATVKVTFLFPAKGDPDDGWIFVNPRPGEGGSLVGAGDIGIRGKIVITADGQVTWLGA